MNKEEYMGEFTCPNCNSHKEPKIATFNENTDADGNRGIKVTYVECVDCGYEESFNS